MTKRRGLIVTDASPLITLGAARALSCLTMAGVSVFIPDMVYAEVTQDIARLGAADVILWVRAHLGQVEAVFCCVSPFRKWRYFGSSGLAGL